LVIGFLFFVFLFLKTMSTNSNEKEKEDRHSAILERAMLNENNAKYFSMDVSKLKKNKETALSDLGLSKKEREGFIRQLKGYIFIEDVADLTYGSSIRWISVMDAVKHAEDKKASHISFHLNSPVIYCELKIGENGMMMLCKTFSRRFFYLRMDECLIFQKLNTQEVVLLSALQHIKK